MPPGAETHGPLVQMVEAGEGALGAMLPVLPASCVAGLLQEGGLVHGLAAETDEMLRMAAARLVATLARYASGATSNPPAPPSSRRSCFGWVDRQAHSKPLAAEQD